MKKVLFAIVLMGISFMGYSQPCTANSPTGTPGLSPTPANVPCIERNVDYDEVIQVENFTVFTTSFGNANVDWARIDSVTNLPCGITWQPDKTLYNAGETGCILVSGKTTDAVGEYALKIYMTFQFDVPAFSLNDQQLSGELHDLEQQGAGFGITIPIDVDYVSRVIETGNNCPAPNYASATDVASGLTCLPVGIAKTDTKDFSVSVYPNPNNGVFEIELITFGQDENYEVKIFDAQGKAVYNETLNVSDNSIRQALQLENLSSGVYTLNLNSTNATYIEKLVIY